MKKFADQIKESVDKYNLLITKIFRNSCYNVSQDIALNSPVSTGKLVGQWAPAKNSASSNSYSGGQTAWQNGWKDTGIAGINRDIALSDLLPRIEYTTNTLSKTDTYYFTNDTDYIKQAEYSGWDNIDAYHMRADAIQNWQLIVNSAVTELAK